MKLSINLKRTKQKNNVISFHDSYYKLILDKYNLDLPNNTSIVKKNNDNNNNNNDKVNKSNISLMDNINYICKMMVISLELCFIRNNNTNSFSKNVKCSKQLIIKIPLVKEVKPLQINMNLQ